MEKVIRFVGISLLVVSIIWMGCSSAKIKPSPITKYNIPLLKGKWEGLSTFGSVSSNLRVPTTMEIYNETVPLKGKLTMHNVPPAVFNPSVPRPNTLSGDVTIQFGDGNINENGNLVGKQGENHFELTLKIGQKLRMDGWIYYSNLNPSVTVSR
ncbi:MAG: hypothetical protein ACXU9L_12230 [Thermodesulfobacteriota bacterium]